MTCPGCPVGTADCRGLVHRRDCANVARGVPGYPEMLRRLAAPPIAQAIAPSLHNGPVRVGFASPVLLLGGAEVWHETLLAHLDRSRINPLGLAVADAGQVDPEMRRRIEAHCRIYLGYDPIGLLASRCDVLVVWGVAALPIAPRSGPTVVAVSHGQGSNGWTRGLLEALSPWAHRYAAVSTWALGAIPPGRLADAAVLPNGVDRARLVPGFGRRAIRRAWGVPPGSKVLGYLGRMSDEKDPHALVRTIGHLPPEWVGVAVGGGYSLDAFRVQARASRRVIAPGPSSDVGSTLAAFDALLVPSREDGFCLVLAEAWSAGVPVVATPVGVALDHPELVRPVPIDDDGRGIAAVVLADRADPEGTRERCRRARAVARHDYSACRFAGRWMTYLEELVGIAPRAGAGCGPCGG